jgi:hypothetical protein
MKRYDHLREKARSLRMDGYAIQEICTRLALSKGTVYPWIKDIPLQRKSRSGYNLRKSPTGDTHASAHWRKLRETAFEQGMQDFSRLVEDVTFRDFVMLFMTEGTRRSVNMVAVCNTNPALVRLAQHWLSRLSPKQIDYQLQVHVDHSKARLLHFWGSSLGIDGTVINFQEKANSSQLTGRNWRSEYGVMTVRVFDTYLRCKLSAWSQCVESTWTFPG